MLWKQIRIVSKNTTLDKPVRPQIKPSFIHNKIKIIIFDICLYKNEIYYQNDVETS